MLYTLKYSNKNLIALKHIKAHRESDSHKIIDFGSLLLFQRKSSVTSTRLFLYIYYIKFLLKINNFFYLLHINNIHIITIANILIRDC